MNSLKSTLQGNQLLVNRSIMRNRLEELYVNLISDNASKLLDKVLDYSKKNLELARKRDKGRRFSVATAHAEYDNDQYGFDIRGIFKQNYKQLFVRKDVIESFLDKVFKVLDENLVYLNLTTNVVGYTDEDFIEDIFNLITHDLTINMNLPLLSIEEVGRIHTLKIKGKLKSLPRIYFRDVPPTKSGFKNLGDQLTSDIIGSVTSNKGSIPLYFIWWNNPFLYVTRDSRLFISSKIKRDVKKINRYVSHPFSF